MNLKVKLCNIMNVHNKHDMYKEFFYLKLVIIYFFHIFIKDLYVLEISNCLNTCLNT